MILKIIFLILTCSHLYIRYKSWPWEIVMDKYRQQDLILEENSESYRKANIKVAMSSYT